MQKRAHKAQTSAQSLHIRIHSTSVLFEAQFSQASKQARHAWIHSFMFFIVLKFEVNNY